MAQVVSDPGGRYTTLYGMQDGQWRATGNDARSFAVAECLGLDALAVLILGDQIDVGENRADVLGGGRFRVDEVVRSHG